MEFTFTPEQTTWRLDVRSFLNSELPDDYDGGDTNAPNPETLEVDDVFLRKLAARGWLVASWPRAYGGAGLGIIDQLIFHEELGYRRGPNLGPGVLFVGPTLIINGNDEQRGRFLPLIAGHQIRWCQGFSEPGTGSDLASLETRAIEDGDDFVVNGSKIWTTMAHHAQWCWLAVRTDPEAPKHRGISLLMVDMKTAGITIRPVHNMAGSHHFNQVYFDDVRVPRANLVGQQNRGWYVMATTLDFERSVITSAAAARRTLEELVIYAKETHTWEHGSIGKDPVVAAKLAQMAIDVEVARLFAYQTASVQLHGRVPNKEASLCKVMNTEMQQRLANLGMQILGPASAVRPGSKWARLEGRIAMRYLNCFSATIASGTSEIQRNIIATRGLGMPR